MKNIIVLVNLLVIVSFTDIAQAKKIYPVTTIEVIFSMSDVGFSQDFINAYPQAELKSSKLRFTAFFHIGEYWHWDITNNFGLISGVGIRNVGLITDEVLPVEVGNTNDYADYKIIRRQYYAGVPFAFKIGSFNDDVYFFAGGEYEFGIHYKEKYWDSHTRKGNNIKSGDWFTSGQSPMFMPSVFGGVQLPGGVNVKFKYYLDDFLDNSYTKSRNSEAGADFNLSDLSRYERSQVFYVSLSWVISDLDWDREWSWEKNTEVVYRY